MMNEEESREERRKRNSKFFYEGIQVRHYFTFDEYYNYLHLLYRQAQSPNDIQQVKYYIRVDQVQLYIYIGLYIKTDFYETTSGIQR